MLLFGILSDREAMRLGLLKVGIGGPGGRRLLLGFLTRLFTSFIRIVMVASNWLKRPTWLVASQLLFSSTSLQMKHPTAEVCFKTVFEGYCSKDLDSFLGEKKTKEKFSSFASPLTRAITFPKGAFSSLSNHE